MPRLLLLVALLAGCGGRVSRTPAGNGAGTMMDMSTIGAGAGGMSGGAKMDMSTIGGGGGGLLGPQKAMAGAPTSIWENDTPRLAYGYAENIMDGRGYTCGRAGFCTGTGDAIQVIDCYDKLRSAADGNLMAKYMPALITINDNFMKSGNQGDTSLLDAVGSWIDDWGKSYSNPSTQADFKHCQDQVSDALYYTPAMQAADRYGLATALTRAALYDMWINQGDDTLVVATNKVLGVAGKLGNGVTEERWLQKFLELRRDLLAGDSTWKTSVDRVAGYEKARRRGNRDLSQPIDSAVKALQCWPTGGYSDSGYSAFVIDPDGTAAPTTEPSGCQ